MKNTASDANAVVGLNACRMNRLIESVLLPRVERPLRYVGNELNMVRKDLRSVRVRGTLCFPDVYELGMSHHGIQILYHIVNSHEGWALGRAFHPWSDAEAIMRREGIPLCCLEYQLPLVSADWVGFTVQYELQYSNIVNMLDLGGIAVHSAQRRDTDPLIILGGPCMSNPEPLAAIADAVAIGDGEELVVALCEILEREAALPRFGRLRALAEIPGIYVPQLYFVKQRGIFVVPEIEKPIRAAKVGSLAPSFYPQRPLVPLLNVVHHRLAVEIMRGCTRGCRFCSAGIYYRPLRERSAEDVIDEVRRGLAATGWCDIGLLSLSTADYSQLTKFLNIVAEMATESDPLDIALPSTRVDALSAEQWELLCFISSPSSLTIAPEAGSQRLRNVINKGFSEQQIFHTVKALFEKNVQTLKLYFMIGLPTETHADLEAIVELVRTISSMAASSARRVVKVSVSPFSPKPHTPFQWEGMDPIHEIEEKSRFLRFGLRTTRNVSLALRHGAVTFLETVLARGDRRVGELIVAAWRRGARLDGWTEHFNLQRWLDAAGDVGIDPYVYVRPIAEDQPLPWGGICTGVSTWFLKRERDRARAGETTPDCRMGQCSACGACRVPLPGRSQLHCRKETEVLTRKLANVKVRKHSFQKRFYYRFIYCKGRYVRFLGHLDMAGVMQRAFRAAGIAVAYSHGFSPMPRMSFGPPLALGMLGEAEVLDVETSEPLDNDWWKRPNAWLPAGLRLTACRALRGKPPSISSSMSAGRYRFEPLFFTSEDELRRRVDEILSASSIELTVGKKGRSIVKDIRPLVYEIKVVECEGRGFGLEAVLGATPACTCRAAEFILAFSPQYNMADFLVTRLSCLSGTVGSWKIIGSEDEI